MNDTTQNEAEDMTAALIAALKALTERVAYYAPAMERNGDLDDARAVLARAGVAP